MNRPQPSDTGLSAIDSEGQDQYRSLSGWAVLGLLLGLLSAIALAHPAAWLIPGLAIVSSGWALHRIRRDSETLIGKPMAIVGLCLGLFFLAWAPTAYWGDRWLIRKQAREFSEQWVNTVLAGQLGVAHQATLPVRERQPIGTDLERYYQRNDMKRAERDAYFNEGLAKQLADLQGEARSEYDRNLGITFDRTYTLTSPRFRIYQKGKAEAVLHLQLEVIREEDEDGVYWTVIRLSDAAAVDRQLETPPL